jgi:hypothetical protein
MNQRTASAPWRAMIASGSTTFFFDFDILMTRPTSIGALSASKVAPSDVRSTSSGPKNTGTPRAASMRL